MKFIHKFLLIALLMGGMAACEQTDLDLQEDPNSVSPDKADPNFLFNAIQLDFNNFNQGFFDLTAGLTRMRNMTADNYTAFVTPGSTNFLWFLAYASLFPDIDALVTLTEERGNLDIHAGAAKIMKASVMLTLVDIYGDVPFSEAGKGVEFISPKADPGAQVYEQALALLDEAIAQLATTTSPKPAADLYYAGAAAKWVTLAQTLKMRAYLQTRLVDSGAGGKFNKVITDGDFIDKIAEDFQFSYGNNRVNPNSRHPFYNGDYESDDGGYMSNYYMWLLAEGKDDPDPRARYYFYRQQEAFDLTDQSLYSCIWSNVPDSNSTPAFYLAVDEDMPYCVGTYDGYYGRDHGNGQGIPPDGPFRTEYGLYPAGGLFDDNSFKFVQTNGTLGAKGEGINPILLATYVDFMRAEAALTMGTGEDAKAMLESGIRKSFEKVLSFNSKGDFSRVIGTGPSGDITAAAFIPDATVINAYVDGVKAEYDAASGDDEKLNIIVREYYIAAWGNGLELYNTLRRTCKPTGLQPNINDLNDPFPRSFVYPQDYIERNANAAQKPDLAQPVFWDTNPAGCVQ